jgi:phosphopentomutase
VPLLVAGGGDPRDLGVREGFWDVGATVAAWLGVERGELPGKGFLR